VLLLLLNSLVKSGPHIATRDEPVLATCAAFGFAEVGQGIGNGATECVTCITFTGLKVGQGDLFDGAKRGGVRLLGRCPWLHVV
jgi:hypothetical protein